MHVQASVDFRLDFRSDAQTTYMHLKRRSECSRAADACLHREWDLVAHLPERTVLDLTAQRIPPSTCKLMILRARRMPLIACLLQLVFGMQTAKYVYISLMPFASTLATMATFHDFFDHRKAFSIAEM